MALELIVRGGGGRPRVGVALGGGGAWGFAHVALLQRLEREGIPIDLISGCSMGAAIGGVYAAGGMSALDALVARRRQLLPRLLAGPRPLERLLARLTGNRRLEELEIPFLPVSVDLRTGEEHVPQTGPVSEAISLASRLPPLWPALRQDGQVLVDGAVSSMVPVAAARAAGADIVIACNVIPPALPRLDTRWRQVLSSVYRMGFRFGESQTAHADLAFQLGDATVWMTDFHKAPEIIARAHERLPTERLVVRPGRRRHFG